MKTLLLSILFLFYIGNITFVKAEQNSISDSLTCTQKLNKAKKVYDAGNITEVDALLKTCLENGFTKEEKMQALRLIILSSLFQDEHIVAEKNLLSLLKEDPEYALNPAVDPAEFYELYNSYRTLPVLNIGLIAGINTTSIQEKQTYSIGSSLDKKPTYKSRIGYHGGIVGDILLYRKFQVHTGAIWNLKNYTYTNTFLYNDATTLTSEENLMWIDVPLALKYNIGKGKLKIFLTAGITYSLLLNSTSTLSRQNIDESNAAKESSLSFKSIRNPTTTSALVGLGVRYKVGYGYIFLDGRYNFGLLNVANPENRFQTENGDNLFYYGYVSSDFNINNMAISVGYMKSIYKPKKIRKLGEDK